MFEKSARPTLVRFCPHSVDVARYAALIQTKSSTNCDVHLTESIFQRALGSAEHFVSNVLQRRLRDDGGSKGNDLPSIDRIQGFENAGDSLKMIFLISIFFLACL